MCTIDRLDVMKILATKQLFHDNTNGSCGIFQLFKSHGIADTFYENKINHWAMG